jgi:hypothetical protein
MVLKRRFYRIELRGRRAHYERYPPLPSKSQFKGAGWHRFVEYSDRKAAEKQLREQIRRDRPGGGELARLVEVRETVIPVRGSRRARAHTRRRKVR